MNKLFRYFHFLQLNLKHPLNRTKKIETLLRIFWWKMNQIFFKFPVIIELVPGLKCICYPTNSEYSSLVMYQKFPEYGEMKFLLKNLSENDNFIDVGANIGVYSLLASTKVKKGKIYAFEPSPNILSQLHSNIALNNETDKIMVLEKGAADKSKLMNFETGNRSDYNHLVVNKIVKKTTIKIKATTLDEFIKKNAIKHIKMIKIDVEGAEMLVLKGLKQSLANEKVDILIVEVNGMSMSFGFSAKDIETYLKSFGFKNYMFDSNYHLSNFVMEKNAGWNIVAIHKSYNRIVKNFNGLG